MERVVIFPGSFDPITYNHLDIISRISRVFEKVIIGVNNENRHPLFTLEERMKIITEVTRGFTNVEVNSYTGLLVGYAKKVEATAIIKGLFDVSNYEYESHISSASRFLDCELETIYIMTKDKHLELNTENLKEVTKNRVALSRLVPKAVEDILKEKYFLKELTS